MHILIIRPGAIGDTLLTLPVLQALRTCYGYSHVMLVGNAAVLPLARATGIVDDTSDYQATQWSELFSSRGITTPSLRAQLQAVELAICWLHDSEGIVTNNLRRVGIPQVITAPGRPAPGERVHILTYLARTIGIELSEAQMQVGLTAAFPQPISSERHLFAIHPGSGGASKCWPVEGFAALITRLWQRDIPVLLLAGPADEARLADLERLLPSPPDPALWLRLINAPLLEIAQKLHSSCRGYLGNDTGITHLAALLGVPALALFGPSDPAIWQPPGPIVRILATSELGNLSVDVVMQRLESLCL